MNCTTLLLLCSSKINFIVVKFWWQVHVLTLLMLWMAYTQLKNPTSRKKTNKFLNFCHKNFINSCFNESCRRISFWKLLNLLLKVISFLAFKWSRLHCLMIIFPHLSRNWKYLSRGWKNFPEKAFWIDMLTPFLCMIHFDTYDAPMNFWTWSFWQRSHAFQISFQF